MSPNGGDGPPPLFKAGAGGGGGGGRALGLRESNQALAELKTKLEFALSRLNDQDTQRTGVEEIREFLQTLYPDWFPVVIGCIGEAGTNLKPLGRCESVKLLGLLAELHGDAVVPLLPRILQVVVTRLQDADLHLREACAETVFRLTRALVVDVECAQAFATLLKPLFGALGEHSKWVQIGAAACICSVIQGSPPEVIRENLGRLISRLVQHLSLPLAMARPQLLSACIYAMQVVSGADFDEALPALMPCLESCLGASSDWQTRKQAIEVLQSIGDNHELGASLELQLPANPSVRPTPLQRRIALLLEAVKTDKVRAVREAVKDVMFRWSIPGKAASASLAGARSSSPVAPSRISSDGVAAQGLGASAGESRGAEQMPRTGNERSHTAGLALGRSSSPSAVGAGCGMSTPGLGGVRDSVGGAGLREDAVPGGRPMRSTSMRAVTRDRESALGLGAGTPSMGGGTPPAWASSSAGHEEFGADDQRTLAEAEKAARNKAVKEALSGAVLNSTKKPRPKSRQSIFDGPANPQFFKSAYTASVPAPLGPMAPGAEGDYEENGIDAQYSEEPMEGDDSLNEEQLYTLGVEDANNAGPVAAAFAVAAASKAPRPSPPSAAQKRAGGAASGVASSVSTADTARGSRASVGAFQEDVAEEHDGLSSRGQEANSPGGGGDSGCWAEAPLESSATDGVAREEEQLVPALRAGSKRQNTQTVPAPEKQLPQAAPLPEKQDAQLGWSDDEVTGGPEHRGDSPHEEPAALRRNGPLHGGRPAPSRSQSGQTAGAAPGKRADAGAAAREPVRQQPAGVSQADSGDGQAALVATPGAAIGSKAVAANAVHVEAQDRNEACVGLAGYDALLAQLEALSARFTEAEDSRRESEERLMSRLRAAESESEARSAQLATQQRLLETQEQRLAAHEQQLKAQEERLQRQEMILQTQGEQLRQQEVQLGQQDQHFEQHDQQLKEHEQQMEMQEQRLDRYKALISDAFSEAAAANEAAASAVAAAQGQAQFQAQAQLSAPVSASSTASGPAVGGSGSYRRGLRQEVSDIDASPTSPLGGTVPSSASSASGAVGAWGGPSALANTLGASVGGGGTIHGEDHVASVRSGSAASVMSSRLGAVAANARRSSNESWGAAEGVDVGGGGYGGAPQQQLSGHRMAPAPLPVASGPEGLSGGAQLPASASTDLGAGAGLLSERPAHGVVPLRGEGLSQGLLQVGASGSQRKSGALWEKVTELCGAQKFLEAYKQVIAEPEETCLLRLMQHTGPIVERLDAESNSRLIRRLIHILSSPSKEPAVNSIEHIFSWLWQALDVGIHFTSSQVEDLATALQKVAAPQSALPAPERAEAARLLSRVSALRRP